MTDPVANVNPVHCPNMVIPCGKVFPVSIASPFPPDVPIKLESFGVSVVKVESSMNWIETIFFEEIAVVPSSKIAPLCPNPKLLAKVTEYEFAIYFFAFFFFFSLPFSSHKTYPSFLYALI